MALALSKFAKESDFADECVHQGLRFGVNFHYTMAVAEFRSITLDGKTADRVGPFQLTQTEWDANSFDEEFGIKDFESKDINEWDMQCAIYALMTLRAQNRFLDRAGRIPSAIELYREQWPDAPGELPGALQTVLDETASFIEAAATKILAAPPGETPTISKADKPASTSAPDLNKSISSKSEKTFLLKAPRIMEKLINDFEFKDFQAAGILGNIGHECDGFRLMQEVHPIGGGRGGFGWCQWTGSRRNSFEAFCSAQGLDPTSDAANYGFLKHELQTSHKASIDALKLTTNFEQAVRAFEQTFEKAKAGFEHFDRRERWGKLALDNFKRQLPAAVAKLLDQDSIYKVIATAKSGTMSYWVIDQFTDEGGQILIAQAAEQEPTIVAHDTTIFPLGANLVPDPIPSAVAAALSASFKPAGNPHPTIPTVPLLASDDEAAALVFAKAKECDETLITRNVPNTNHGRLACAFAVNEVVRRALGKPIGGGLSTAVMAKMLRDNHTPADENQVAAGMIIISPTQGGNVGHVGIIGAIKNPVSATTIYSNSSSRGVFSDKFTLDSWKNFYHSRKGLPVSFFALRRQSLGK
jgi:hypothetical protein